MGLLLVSKSFTSYLWRYVIIILGDITVDLSKQFSPLIGPPTIPWLKSDCEISLGLSQWRIQDFPEGVRQLQRLMWKAIITDCKGKVMFSQVFVYNRPDGYSFTTLPCCGVVGMHPTGMLSCLTNFFPTTAWNWKNLDRGGGRSWRPHRSVNVNICKEDWYPWQIVLVFIESRWR